MRLSSFVRSYRRMRVMTPILATKHRLASSLLSCLMQRTSGTWTRSWNLQALNSKRRSVWASARLKKEERNSARLLIKNLTIDFDSRNFENPKTQRFYAGL